MVDTSFERSLPETKAELEQELLKTADLSSPREQYLWRIHLLVENGALYSELRAKSPLDDATIDRMDGDLRALYAMKGQTD